MGFTHYPPVDEAAGRRLRDATRAWAPLLGELMAVGLRPYLELEHGERDDPLRLYCELEGDLLLDISRADEDLPDTPAEPDGRFWGAGKKRVTTGKRGAAHSGLVGWWARKAWKIRALAILRQTPEDH